MPGQAGKGRCSGLATRYRRSRSPPRSLARRRPRSPRPP